MLRVLVPQRRLACWYIEASWIAMALCIDSALDDILLDSYQAWSFWGELRSLVGSFCGVLTVLKRNLCFLNCTF